ncbi:hypothetical protein HNY73_019982 [Argiope bruennichi]|uniref:Uncharacterized protein n=1 Tax=Argiope bruennichi TaxID=94029 RepID=A0A8T0E6J0_ARGBR|nr:hypothetical protein HNY73_019982 [Argiope bruennichi]
MNSPKPEVPVKKIRYGQLRGTVAQKYRHRIALGFTLGTLTVGLICSYLLFKIKPNPNKGIEKLENPMIFLRKRGYKPFLEQQKEPKIDIDKL